jgi:hypothetical protein
MEDLEVFELLFLQGDLMRWLLRWHQLHPIVAVELRLV